jgi:UDP-3-O-[3-hydroxymyristoyl] glucosamine N-acyltransferase
MRIGSILKHNPKLEIKFGGFREFASVGPVNRDDELLLTYAADRRFVEYALSRDNLAALFCKPEDAPKDEQSIALIISPDPKADFFRFHNYLATETSFYGEDRPSKIPPDADIRPGAHVAEQNVCIASGAVVHPGAVLLDGTIVETGAVIGPGAVLGLNGARIIQPMDGKRFAAIHIGGVLIREGAFLGANCVIVRSVWHRPTTVGRNVHIGNLVNVGHNCLVGDGAMVLSSAVLCGSSEVGEDAVVGPGAIVTNQKRVGRGGWVSLGAVATQDVEPGQHVSGNFAIEHARLLRHVKELSQD